MSISTTKVHVLALVEKRCSGDHQRSCIGGHCKVFKPVPPVYRGYPYSKEGLGLHSLRFCHLG